MGNGTELGCTDSGLLRRFMVVHACLASGRERFCRERIVLKVRPALWGGASDSSTLQAESGSSRRVAALFFVSIGLSAKILLFV